MSKTSKYEPKASAFFEPMTSSATTGGTYKNFKKVLFLTTKK